jgi:nickel/cobalt transporter (NicO) family protein
MRALAFAGLVFALVVAVWLWGLGGADDLVRQAGVAQRAVQDRMAGALRALQQGDPTAVATLWGLCFAYGFVHAAGPGHGKLVIGGYGLATRIAVWRLAALALLSSLGQAVTAVAVVYGAVALLGWGRAQMTDLAEQILAPISYALIVTFGLWLALRGWRRWRAMARPAQDAGVCASCGHTHGPTPAQAAAIRHWRDAVAIVAAVALRPCTGAMFLLVLTWRFGLDWVGIAGAFIMALGTASITVVVALAAVVLRETMLQLALPTGAGKIMALAQIAFGGVIALAAVQLLQASL